MSRIPALFRLSLCACLLAAGAAHADPLRLSTLQGLAFGAFSSNTGGTVSMSPNGARANTGGVYLLSSDVGSAAQFLATGNNNLVYSITLPNVAVLSSGGATMQINNFVSLPAGGRDTGKLTGGVQVIKVGATLQVAAGQANGTYSGTFSVSINNN
jgi:hypothetical protein